MPYLSQSPEVNMAYFTDNNASGGTGGGTFAFIKLNEGAVLSRIKAWTQDWRFRAVEVWMSDQSHCLVGQRVGKLSEFTFKPGEQITSLNLQASGVLSSRNTRRLGAIHLKTNKDREWGVFCNGLKSEGEYRPDVGSGICCGVFGSHGADVDRLGFAMLRPVQRAVLTDVKYPNLDRELVANTPETIVRREFKNGTNLEQTYTLSASRSVTTTRKWSLSTGVSLSTKVTVTGGIPLIADISASVEWTLSSTTSHEASETTTETKNWSWTLNCPPNRRILGKATMYFDSINTPYEARLELHLANGKVFMYTIKGIYEGLQARSGSVTIDDLGPYGERR